MYQFRFLKELVSRTTGAVFQKFKLISNNLCDSKFNYVSQTRKLKQMITFGQPKSGMRINRGSDFFHTQFAI